MTQPADEERNYDFTFRSEMDRVAPELFAYQQVVRVHGASGQAVMLQNRHGGDMIRLPVGLFGTTLSKQQVAKVATTLDAIKWSELPRPKGGDINAAILSIDYSRGARIIQRSLNSRNTELLQALTPVMDQVSELGRVLEASPRRTVEVSVARTPQGFKLILRNAGTGPVLVADPRLPPGGANGGKPRGAVRVAAAPPKVDFTDLTWEAIALAPLGAAPAVVTIDPGKTHEFETVPWAGPTPGDHWAQASWEDYAGPDIDPKTVMPMLPAPDQLDDARPYLVRGAAFSAYVKFSIDKARR
jgi:hypothetical protein